jgi:hypothetical protein
MEFQLVGLDQVLRNVQRVGPFLSRELGAQMYEDSERIMTESKSNVPVDLGVLRASGRVQSPVYTDRSVTVTLSYGGAASAYAVYVHEGIGPAVGRPAFMPPVEPFEEWARRHGMEGMGFVIARAVGMRGLKPTKYLERPFLNYAGTLPSAFATKLRARLEGFRAN